MRIDLRQFLVTVGLIIVCGISLPIHAMEMKALPDFGITTLAGAPLRSGVISGESRWLLIYIRPDCPQCRDLMTFLAQGQPATLSQRTVIVLGGGTARGIAFSERYPKLSGFAWYLDPDLEGWERLGLTGTPVTIGIENGIMRWSLQGLPGERPRWQSIIGDWVK
jgi:hypothetical protein